MIEETILNCWLITVDHITLDLVLDLILNHNLTYNQIIKLSLIFFK